MYSTTCIHAFLTQLPWPCRLRSRAREDKIGGGGGRNKTNCQAQKWFDSLFNFGKDTLPKMGETKHKLAQLVGFFFKKNVQDLKHFRDSEPDGNHSDMELSNMVFLKSLHLFFCVTVGNKYRD